MTTLLHIDTSARSRDQSGNHHCSISKTLAHKFQLLWVKQMPHTHLIYRDLGTTPPNLINQAWIEAAFTAEKKRTPAQNTLLSQSDELIDEVIQADIILLSTPMYNYGMPAALKTWFDQVIRVNKTFNFDVKRGDFPLRPILAGKTLVLMTSSGEFGFELGGIRE